MKPRFIKIQGRYILIDDILRVSSMENRLEIWLDLSPSVEFFFDSESAAKNACQEITSMLDRYVLIEIN